MIEGIMPSDPEYEEYSGTGQLYSVPYSKSVRFYVGEHKTVTAEDLCSGHKWRHRVSKRFRSPLPKDWVYCPKCRTEVMESLLKEKV